VEQVYHQRVHSETKQAPLARFLAAGPPVPTPAALLAEAFRWAEWRTVGKTATVSLHGNLYEVDPALAGSKVELVFDPLREVSRNGSYAQPRIMLSADLGLLRGDPFRLSEFA
jgi:putative transposase